MEALATPEPHYVPGYTGYCPQFIYRAGDTYGTLTHKLIIDPCVPHSENLVVSNRLKSDYNLERPTLREIDLVKTHEKRADPVYKYPTIPGYEGYVPNIVNKIGDRYFIAATEGIADFEKHMLKLNSEKRRLKHCCAIPDYNVNPKDYRLPLQAVRPEAAGIARSREKVELPKAPPLPYSKDSPPHFMDNKDEEKYIKAGYGGHVPFSWPIFGQGSKPLTNSALCEFANNYHFRKSTEWAPISDCGIGTPKPTGYVFELYPKNMGLIPNYAGHVPGEVFRFGKTFGDATRDAKRKIRNARQSS